MKFLIIWLIVIFGKVNMVSCFYNLNYSYNWTESVWSNCSVECGIGIQIRTLNCLRSDGIIVPNNNCSIQTPSQLQNCTFSPNCSSSDLSIHDVEFVIIICCVFFSLILVGWCIRKRKKMIEEQQQNHFLLVV